MADVKQQALWRLKYFNAFLTSQQYKTLRGQVLAGDVAGAMKGLDTLLERRKAYATAKRQGS